MSEEVQIEGAEVEILSLKEMHREPVGGKYNPFVLSVEGLYKASSELLEQFV